jgi:hypothetical protein
MGEICNMRRLGRTASSAEKLQRSARVKELSSAIGTALVLLDRVEPNRDRL